MGDVVPGVEEALALDPRSGVRRIKRRLVIRSAVICPLSDLQVASQTCVLRFFRVGATERPDHEVARLLGENRGAYCHHLGGWLVGFEHCGYFLFW